MNNSIRFGILATILLGGGTFLFLNEDEYDHAYVCTKNNKIGIFEYLSSTNKTGYWYENEILKQSTCTAGTWELCKTSNNPVCKNITITDIKEDVYTGKIWCYDDTHCELIVN